MASCGSQVFFDFLIWNQWEQNQLTFLFGCLSCLILCFPFPGASNQPHRFSFLFPANWMNVIFLFSLSPWRNFECLIWMQFAICNFPHKKNQNSSKMTSLTMKRSLLGLPVHFCLHYLQVVVLQIHQQLKPLFLIDVDSSVSSSKVIVFRTDPVFIWFFSWRHNWTQRQRCSAGCV